VTNLITSRALFYPIFLQSCSHDKLAVHVVGRNSAIRSAIPENPTLEPNMEWIGQPVAEIWLYVYGYTPLYPRVIWL